MLKRLFNFLPTLAQSWNIVILIMLVGGVLVTSLLLLLQSYNLVSVGNINMLVQYILPLIPGFIYIYIKGGQQEEDKHYTIEKTNTGKVNKIIFFALIAISILCIAALAEPLTSWIEMPQTLKKTLEAITQNSGWAFITTVLAAPLLEEYLLRGVIMRGLLKHSQPIRAIVWSAAIFAVIHFNVWQAIGAFLAGCFIGWIYWRTHSIWACIYIHMINNGFSYFMYLLNPQLDVDTTYQEILAPYGSYAYPAMYIACSVTLIVILYYLNKYLPRKGF